MFQQQNSYSAADVDIPIKILHDVKFVWEATQNKNILLRHLQLCPTNRCNLNCKFCSCGDRDKSQELSLGQVKKILNNSRKLGCNAITITGGGEPLLHPQINEIIAECDDLGIKVGLVTNGLLLDRLERRVDWCRISFDGDRDWETLVPVLRTVVPKFRTDWAFSYVLNTYNEKTLRDVVEFANNHNFTHVRIVGNILKPSDGLIRCAKKILYDIDDKVIYQPRSHPTKGREKCWISLLKPTISAEGKIYPCCGIQYARKGQKRDFQMDMGDDLLRMKIFDGSKCEVCYYEGYNRLLDMLVSDINHKEWM
jgi:MoaA/NifB/PqqE/SkfB family radical SAM enzyme